MLVAVEEVVSDAVCDKEQTRNLVVEVLRTSKEDAVHEIAVVAVAEAETV